MFIYLGITFYFIFWTVDQYVFYASWENQGFNKEGDGILVCRPSNPLI